MDNCGCGVNGGGCGSSRDFYRNSLGAQLFMMKRPRSAQAAVVTISFKDDVKSVENESKEHVIEQKAKIAKSLGQ